MNFALPLLALIALPTFAFAENFKSTYEDLDVKATKVDQGGRVGSVAYRKKVGGLTCTESKAVVPHPKPSFACELDSSPAGDAKIYAALKVEERKTTPDGMLGSLTMEKKSGSLVCSKSNAVVRNPKPTFHCELDNEEQDGEDSYDHDHAE